MKSKRKIVKLTVCILLIYVELLHSKAINPMGNSLQQALWLFTNDYWYVLHLLSAMYLDFVMLAWFVHNPKINCIII